MGFEVTNPLYEPWKELERVLGEVLADDSLGLSEHDRSQVQHYIDHNEFGLAFEELVASLDQSQPTLTRKTFAAVDTAGRKMALDPQIWQHLEELIP